MPSRFLVLAAVLSGMCSCAGTPTDSPSSARNVILIMTDDQGFGDFGFAGNPVIRTPNFDALAAQSSRLANFYVSPVCAPTRASLLTGRHAQRTRAFDTYIGRAMMDPDEVTVAEILRDTGWSTGIFGKWHLGDCYPMRAMDQGFDEALVHRGGGIGQPSDPPGGERKYTDAVLFHNGEQVETKGYCTDVYFDRAIEWMGDQHRKKRPFFAYIPTNAPHGPFHDVPGELLEYYKSIDLSPARFPQRYGHMLPARHDANRLARVFAMIENIDQNIGKLLAALERMGIADDTLVLFLVDNGPNTRRYVGGFRAMKGSIYEGGVRSPLLARWPRRLPAGAVNDGIAAHYDLLPTILDACGVAVPAGVRLDGHSVLPLLENKRVEGPDRHVFIQAHRGDKPVRYHNCLVRSQRFKLVNPSGFGRELDRVEPDFELYDLQADPYETKNVANVYPEVVAEMLQRYERFFDDIYATRADVGTPPPIYLGAPQAPNVVLTRQDWKRTSRRGGWGGRSMGYWEVQVVRPGPFEVQVRFLRATRPKSVKLTLGTTTVQGTPRGRTHTFKGLRLPTGRGRLQVEVEDDKGRCGAYQVELTYER